MVLALMNKLNIGKAMGLLGFKKYIVYFGYYFFILLSLNGCVLHSWAPNIGINYLGKNIDEVTKSLESHGMTCFSSGLVITRMDAKESVIDTERKILNCNILQKKWMCPIEHSLKMDYSINTRIVTSNTRYSEVKQCF